MAQVLVLQAQMLVGTSGAGQRLAGSGRRPHCTSCGIPLKSGVDEASGVDDASGRDRAPDGDEAPGANRQSFAFCWLLFPVLLLQ